MPAKKKPKRRMGGRGRRRTPAGPPPPPPPPEPVNARSGMAPPPAPVPPEILELGSPPKDALAAQLWAYKLQIATLADAARDPSLTAAERRREIRVIAASAAKLLPRAALAEAAALVKASRAEIEDKRTALKRRRGALLEPVLPRGGAPTVGSVEVVAAGDHPPPPPTDAQH